MGRDTQGTVGDNAQTQTGHKSGLVNKTPFCLIKSYSLCGVTPTYLTLQSVDAVKQALDPRVTFVSYITKLHGPSRKAKFPQINICCP